MNREKNMKRIKPSFLVSFSAVFLAFTQFAHAAHFTVATPKEYKDVAKKLASGDVVTLKNGVWNDFEILLDAKGTEQNPITLQAQTPGKVILSGQSNLRLAGEYLVVKGLVFKNGFTPSNAVISFRKNKDEMAFNSRVTEVVIDDYSNPDKRESDYWVALYGQNNRFDHNYLAGKRNKGVTVAVRLDSKQSQQNSHHIDHNYFGPRPVFGSNGGETLRIGTSHYSLTDSLTQVTNNYFDQCDGEVEIISVKSGKNVIKNNTFFESRGTLTLRHGNGNVVEENVFFGNSVDHTGGIRVINKHQIVRNNYLEGLTGYRFGSGLTVMNGVPNSKINRYHQVDNALIENNTLINVLHIQLAAGSDAERSATPINSVMRNNVIYNENSQDVFTAFDDISGIKFSDNLLNGVANPTISKGFISDKLTLERADNGLLYVKGAKYRDLGAAKTLKPTQKDQTGPSWYPKKPLQTAFDSGKTHTVNSASEGALFNAIKAAGEGDIIELKAGEYNVAKMLKINKTITLRGAKNEKPTITFERSTLFEINNGGSLKLENLVLSGKNSPDSTGNTLIRTAKWGMYKNYRLTIDNIKIVDLDVNHSFHFFDSGSGAFADAITITNSEFKNISGDIVRLNKETDDLGIYNAEYLTLKNNKFTNIDGAIAQVYRGGRDESTFGPHVTVINNTFNNVSNGKRNKQQASFWLHGAQVSTIEHNHFNAAAKIKVEHTVGEPKTRIEDNKFVSSAAPKVTELVAPQTQSVINNEFNSAN
jgi:poly(beta-D-mannuronate) lyase